MKDLGKNGGNKPKKQNNSYSSAKLGRTARDKTKLAKMTRQKELKMAETGK